MATAAPPVSSANKAELLAIADAVAREKLIDRGIVIEAMEDAIQRAARARYGAENDIRAKLDPTSGDLRLWRVLEVTEEVEDHFKQIDPKGAQKLQKDAAVGDFIVDPLPNTTPGGLSAARRAAGGNLGDSRGRHGGRPGLPDDHPGHAPRRGTSFCTATPTTGWRPGGWRRSSPPPRSRAATSWAGSSTT